jgi:PAS domain S-box-containing protein
MWHVFASLRKRGLLTPAGVVIGFLIILSLIILLSQFFHQSLQNEMADQFNRQQLLLAQQIAINIQGFLDHVYNDINVISRLPDISQKAPGAASRSVIESIHFHLESDIVLSVRILDGKGILLYDSADPRREGSDLSGRDYFQKVRSLPRSEKMIAELRESAPNGQTSKQIVMAVPIYRRPTSDAGPSFNGVVLAMLSLDGITEKYLASVKSGARGYAWMMDSSGTLLYHPTQPQMVGKNLYHSNTTCFQCHRSFDMEKRMIEGEMETYGYYVAPGGENKLAAYYRLSVGSKSWIVVVSAPYSEVIGLMHKSRMFYSFLIVSIFVTTLVAAGIFIVTYKKQIKAEEKAMHLENQRRLEQEVVIAKNYLENIIENTKTSLMVLDSNLIVRTINSAQARAFNRSKDEITGRSLPSLFPTGLPPYDGIPLEALLNKTLVKGKTFEINEYRMTGVAPEPIYLDMIVSPLLIAGEVTGIVITSSNVTKRVELEEALKKYTVELEVKVDRETATARKLEQQVLHSEKLAALGRLAAGIAHEIGNPLTSISTFAQLLREMATDEFSQSTLDTINTHIHRITEIVRQMSTFARPDSTTLRFQQVNDTLRSSLDLMRFDKRMKSTIEIEMHLDPDLPKTLFDEGQLAQVFINIILNALDAMPENGTLTVSTGQVVDDRGHEAIAISFADTGTGIPPVELEKIFDPFYTTKEPGKGTGLGLSVSYNIVKRFHGDIKVESALGKGTTFTVLLPLEIDASKERLHAQDEHPRR